jgi:hypothetical protein
MARTPSTPQAGESHRPYPALSRFAPQNKILFFPPQTSTPPPFSRVSQPPGRMGAEYFCGGGQKEDFVLESAPAFHQGGSFPIKRGGIYLAGLQIKFVDDNLHQRRSRDRKKQSQ